MTKLQKKTGNMQQRSEMCRYDELRVRIVFDHVVPIKSSQYHHKRTTKPGSASGPSKIPDPSN